jgi:hypothetical protein
MTHAADMRFPLKYVFYFESLLMGVTCVLGLFAPHVLLAQIAPGVAQTTLSVQLARWYGVPFLPLTWIQLAALASGHRHTLRLVMLTYLVTDLTQAAATIVFASALGWSQAHYVSLGTAVPFVISRALCYRNLDRLGVRLTGAA